VYHILLAVPEKIDVCMAAMAIHHKKAPLVLLRPCFWIKHVLKPKQPLSIYNPAVSRASISIIRCISWKVCGLSCYTLENHEGTGKSTMWGHSLDN
jgi:hypothetical protein